MTSRQLRQPGGNTIIARAIHTVELGRSVVTRDPTAILHTPPIGSSVAVAICSPDDGLAGILHFLLPDSKADERVRAIRPEIFADTGIQALIENVVQLATERDRLRAYLVGGSDLMQSHHSNCTFILGERNVATARALIAEAGIRLVAARVGGARARRITIELDSGKVRITETPTHRKLDE